MTILKPITCTLVVIGSFLGATSVASADGLVGVYVYPHPYGLVISSFIPGSSAERLHWQGELFTGDIITRYNGYPVRCAHDVIAISRPGAWMKMEFMTPTGEPFWHWVQPGCGAAACMDLSGGAKPVMDQGGVAAAQSYKFKTGASRPSASQIGPSGSSRPQSYPSGSGRPQGYSSGSDRPQGYSSGSDRTQGYSSGPGRPR